MRKIVVILSLMLLVTSCGFYSLTGASIPAEAKTVSVQYFPNNAPLVHPQLSNTLTNALRDMFMTQTTLEQVDHDGDLAIEGEITDYSTYPVAITGDQTAALNRLKITINVRFYNRFDDSKDFETTFSQYEDYPSKQDLNSVQDELIELIVKKLAEDVFNKAVVNW